MKLHKITELAPKRYADNEKVSINVLIYHRNGDVEDCRIAYYEYESNTWKILGYQYESIADYPYWMYIPENPDMSKDNLPKIDGE